jgi:hypothetical protein
MTKICIILLLTLTHVSASAQSRRDYLISFSDTTSGEELFGFKAKNGDVIIKPKYEITSTARMYAIAFVTNKFRWVAINTEKTAFFCRRIFMITVPMNFAKDYFDSRKMVRLDLPMKKERKSLRPGSNMFLNFVNGLALFNVGGHADYADPEHPTWDGGLWGFVNKNGIEVIRPQFISAYAFGKRFAEVWTENEKHVLIDRNGRIRKVLTK